MRPSNAASFRRSGSAGSTTIADSPLESSAEASARPTSPPPKMMTSARSMAPPYTARKRRWRRDAVRLTARLRDEALLTLEDLRGGWDMATAPRGPEAGTGARLAGCAARRRAAASPCARWGALLVALSLAGGVALATHNPTDPSLQHRRRRPADQLARQRSALIPATLLLLLFGLGSVLFLPVIALAGLRMMRLRAGRPGRPRTAARRDRRRAARHRAEPDQRLGGVGPARRLGRRARPRRRARRRLRAST